MPGSRAAGARRRRFKNGGRGKDTRNTRIGNEGRIIIVAHHLIGPSMVQRTSSEAWVHFCHRRLIDLPQVLLLTLRVCMRKISLVVM